MIQNLIYLGIFLFVIGLMLVAVYLEREDNNESQASSDQVPPTRGER